MSIRKNTACGISVVLALTINGIEAKATTTNNNVSVSAAYPQRVYIDIPWVNQVYNNQNVVVSGWALDNSGVKDVNIYVDDNLFGKSNYGVTRPDVNQAFPGYPSGGNSGFGYTIDSSRLSNGTHKVVVESVGNNGGKITASKYITVNKKTLPTGGAIDIPGQGENVTKGKLGVAGWAISQNGVKEIKVYLDEKYMGNATLGMQRSDIGNAYTQYPNAVNSGYLYELDTYNLSKGNHKVKIEILGNLGEKAVAEKTFSYQGLENITYIDEPVNGSSCGASSVRVSGWALNQSNVKKVNIFLDGILKGEATLGGERLDVNNAFPGYQNGKNSGYNYNLDLSAIAKGYHEILVQAVGDDGSVKNSATTIMVNKLDNLLSIDSPVNGTTIEDNNITVSGWSLNNSGTKEIRILVDGNEKVITKTGVQRLDVDKVFPGYPDGKTSGYSYSLDVSTLNDGVHHITVKAIGNNGAIKQETTTITLKKKVVIPDPGMNITYKDYANTLDYYVDRQYSGTLNVVWPGRLATKDEVKTYMDAEQYINDPVAKFIFLKLTYIDGVNPSDLNNALLGKGVLDGKGQAFVDGGKKYNINPIYLVAHSMLETGNGTSALAKGILVTSVDGQPVEPKITYNVYGVGAVDSAPDQKGSEYAYKQGWFTVEDAIIGGAQFIGKNYINSAIYKQDTLYKMKWDLESVWHEYATDIGWANKNASNIKKIIDKMKNPPLQFEVPRFKKQ